MTASPPQQTTVAFVCVQNAGRSQMATAFARKIVDDRRLGDRIDVITGGTRPADAVHDTVIDAMAEVDIDVSDRTPRTIEPDELRDADYVITMGCSASAVCPAGFGGESRDWGLPDPDDADLDGTRAIRDEIEQRVNELIDELEASIDHNSSPRS